MIGYGGLIQSAMDVTGIPLIVTDVFIAICTKVTSKMLLLSIHLLEGSRIAQINLLHYVVAYKHFAFNIEDWDLFKSLLITYLYT